MPHHGSHSTNTEESSVWEPVGVDVWGLDVAVVLRVDCRGCWVASRSWSTHTFADEGQNRKLKMQALTNSRAGFFFFQVAVGKVLPCPLHKTHRVGQQKVSMKPSLDYSGWGLDSCRLVLRHLTTNLLANADNPGVCLLSNQKKYFH